MKAYYLTTGAYSNYSVIAHVMGPDDADILALYAFYCQQCYLEDAYDLRAELALHRAHNRLDEAAQTERAIVAQRQVVHEALWGDDEAPPESYSREDDFVAWLCARQGFTALECDEAHLEAPYYRHGDCQVNRGDEEPNLLAEARTELWTALQQHRTLYDQVTRWLSKPGYNYQRPAWAGITNYSPLWHMLNHIGPPYTEETNAAHAWIARWLREWDTQQKERTNGEGDG